MEVFKEPDFPEGWWTDEKLFMLERRAIFSKTWICVVHRSRFTRRGDYISMEMAGFPIFIILGKDNIPRAFHNVCRHRAYAVTKKVAGSSLVLGCKYHGWSYDTKGNLVKAPQFDGIDGFDKAQNGLFKIHTCTDKGGFIHINLDADEIVEPPSCEQIISFSTQYGITAQSSWVAGWEIRGGFNWKVAAQDPIENKVTQCTQQRSNSIFAYMLMFRGTSVAIRENERLSLSPLTTVKTIAGTSLWLALTVLPVSASKSSVRCDVYSTRKISVREAYQNALSNNFQGWVRELECRYAKLKDEPLSDKPVFLPLLKAHLKLEQMSGGEILPGSRREGRSSECWRAEQVCKELDELAGLRSPCGTTGDGQGPLEW